MSSEVKVTIKYGAGHAEPWIVVTGTEDEVTDTLQRFVKTGELDALVRQAALLAYSEGLVERGLGGVDIDAPEALTAPIVQAEDEPLVEDSLTDKIESCGNIDALRALYTEHSDEIQGNLELQNAFTAKAAVLNA